MFFNYIILIIFTVTDQLVSYVVVSNTADCDPNRVYKKHDVTCICSEEGRWPHQNCSVVFKSNENNVKDGICEPDSFVTVDCNICRCSKSGNIDREFCTKHSCEGYDHIKIIRRSNNGRHKCEPNHWYALTGCRLCYCINRNNLLCNSGVSNPKKVLLGTYNLTDCGSNLLSDINKLLTTKDPLGTNRSNKKKKDHAANTEYDIQTRTTPTLKITSKDIFSVIFNREGNNEDKELPDNSDKNDVERTDEDISDTETPVIPKEVPIARLAANTAIPFENDEDDSNNDSFESDRDNSDEMDDNKKESDDLYKSQEENSELLVENKQNTENRQPKKLRLDKTVINLNIPGILEKMFQFRKSLVSLDSADCVPGSTVAVKCNTCFCLKNGKMLCTEKKCD